MIIRCLKEVFPKKLILSMFIVITISGFGCMSKEKVIEGYSKESFAMDTVITQKIYNFSQNETEVIFDYALNRLIDIENLMSNKIEDSEISNLNKFAGTKQKVELSMDTKNILAYAMENYKKTEGYFNIGIGNLINLWNVRADNPQIPDIKSISAATKNISMDNLVIDKKSAQIKSSGFKIDLGSIGKGYACDEVIKVYKQYGVNSALINMGGNVYALGQKANGKNWMVGVQDPRSKTGNYIGILEISDQAVVTSGDYQRYFIQEGKRYHHILDPYTGQPSETGIMSVTIVADNALQADLLSTATFLMGLSKGRQLIINEGVEGIFITKDKKIYVTEGLRDVFKLNNISGEYDYVENW
jgi:thiamine biosynthesis lipoprotein